MIDDSPAAYQAQIIGELATGENEGQRITSRQSKQDGLHRG